MVCVAASRLAHHRFASRRLRSGTIREGLPPRVRDRHRQPFGPCGAAEQTVAGAESGDGEVLVAAANYDVVSAVGC